jgi:hypothetical protein
MVSAALAVLAAAWIASAEDTVAEKDARITEAEARAIALRHAPGTVKESELEKEKGTLVWSFDIDDGKGITEVLVSALDGHIVGTEQETYEQEKAEKAKEAAEKKARATRRKDAKDKEHH